MTLESAMRGCLLGTAVGDAIGLPREGLSRRRAERMFGATALEHRLIAGRGMCSDDTEHAAMTAQALIVSQGDSEGFARSLAWRLRLWLLGAPAGVGLATLRATAKLWIGFPPHRSGVFSAGNGPAMRAPLLGLYAGDNDERLRRLVRSSTRLTHTDPRAEEGALAVALAAREAYRRRDKSSAQEVMSEIRRHLNGPEICQSLAAADDFISNNASAAEFAEHLGLGRGVSGYINHTVPVALFCWLRYQDDFRRAVEECIRLGGDTDTTGAIVGALTGASLGEQAIPESWSHRLIDWPRSWSWLVTLAGRLAGAAQGENCRPLPIFWPALVPRNALFAGVVLAHGFRRLGPPY